MAQVQFPEEIQVDEEVVPPQNPPNDNVVADHVAVPPLADQAHVAEPQGNHVDQPELEVCLVIVFDWVSSWISVEWCLRRVGSKVDYIYFTSKECPDIANWEYCWISVEWYLRRVGSKVDYIYVSAKIALIVNIIEYL